MAVLELPPKEPLKRVHRHGARLAAHHKAYRDAAAARAREHFAKATPPPAAPEVKPPGTA